MEAVISNLDWAEAIRNEFELALTILLLLIPGNYLAKTAAAVIGVINRVVDFEVPNTRWLIANSIKVLLVTMPRGGDQSRQLEQVAQAIVLVFGSFTIPASLLVCLLAFLTLAYEILRCMSTGEAEFLEPTKRFIWLSIVAGGS